jgi:hypothetical protein
MADQHVLMFLGRPAIVGQLLVQLHLADGQQVFGMVEADDFGFLIFYWSDFRRDLVADLFFEAFEFGFEVCEFGFFIESALG